MRCDDLQMLYRHLRRELDAAYAARPWDGARIDRIAEDLLHLEHTLRARHEQPIRGGFGVTPIAARR